jgi:hypothetical protein
VLRLAASVIPALLAAGSAFASEDRPALGAGRALIARRIPRVVHRWGPVLWHPEITTVTFAGESANEAARLEAFGDHITRSRWWRAVTDGYCVAGAGCIGDGRRGGHVRLHDVLPAMVRDADLEMLLAAEARFGALQGLGRQALVLVYLPPGVVLRDAFHERYCHGGPRAYHRMLRTEGTGLAYAVIPRCANDGSVTGVASHEIVEAVTNPDPDHPGFRVDAGPSGAGFTSSGAEPVDPCGVITRDTHWTVERGFAVQRAWSNRAAAGGHDPCVPSDRGRPFVAMVPRAPVVRIPAAGATVTVPLDAVADCPIEAWAVSTIVLGRHVDPSFLEAHLDRGQVRPGHAAALTLRLVRMPAATMAVVGVVSTVGSRSHVWPLVVSLR